MHSYKCCDKALNYAVRDGVTYSRVITCTVSQNQADSYRLLKTSYPIVTNRLSCQESNVNLKPTSFLTLYSQETYQ